MKAGAMLPLTAALPAAYAASLTRPFTAPIATPPPSSTHIHVNYDAASSGVPANPNGIPAPRNVAFVAYAYDDQWDGTNTNEPPIDVLSLYQNNTGTSALVINPCGVQSAYPSIVQCHNWNFTNSVYWEQIWPDYQSVQANGIPLIASFGGYGSDTFELLSQDWDLYYPPIVNMLKTYKFDGIDLDIEPAFNTEYTPPLSLALQLVNSIRNDMGPYFIITVTPISSDMWQNGGSQYSGFSSWELDQNATTTDTNGNTVKSINWFTPQFYAGGGSASVDNYEYLIQNGNWDPSRVTLLAACSGAESGWLNITTLEGIASSLTQTYGHGTFRGVGGYEYARAGQSDDITNHEWFTLVSQAQGIAASGR